MFWLGGGGATVGGTVTTDGGGGAGATQVGGGGSCGEYPSGPLEMAPPLPGSPPAPGWTEQRTPALSMQGGGVAGAGPLQTRGSQVVGGLGGLGRGPGPGPGVGGGVLPEGVTLPPGAGGPGTPGKIGSTGWKPQSSL